MYEDKTLQCIDCGAEFIYTARDQEFYEAQGYTPPKRCKPCRLKKKQRQDNGGGGGQRRDNNRGYREYGY